MDRLEGIGERPAFSKPERHRAREQAVLGAAIEGILELHLAESVQRETSNMPVNADGRPGIGMDGAVGYRNVRGIVQLGRIDEGQWEVKLRSKDDDIGRPVAPQSDYGLSVDAPAEVFEAITVIFDDQHPSHAVIGGVTDDGLIPFDFDHDKPAFRTLPPIEAFARVCIGACKGEGVIVLQADHNPWQHLQLGEE